MWRTIGRVAGPVEGHDGLGTCPRPVEEQAEAMEQRVEEPVKGRVGVVEGTLARVLG